MNGVDKKRADKSRGLSRFFGAHRFTCVCCGADVFDDSGICDFCLPRLLFNNGKTCARCGAALGDVDNRFCAACEKFDEVFFDGAASAFVYGGETSRLILKMKYGGAKYLSEFFARFMAKKFFTLSVGFDLAIPVPMTKSAKKKRGYNQAELLTAEFCDIIEADFRFDLLEKVRETPQQETLGFKQRRENLKGAFSAKRDAALEGKRILLIDDVKTTGATINLCAKALKKAGAAYVLALTAASSRDIAATERDLI